MVRYPPAISRMQKGETVYECFTCRHGSSRRKQQYILSTITFTPLALCNVIVVTGNNLNVRTREKRETPKDEQGQIEFSRHTQRYGERKKKTTTTKNSRKQCGEVEYRTAQVSHPLIPSGSGHHGVCRSGTRRGRHGRCWMVVMVVIEVVVVMMNHSGHRHRSQQSHHTQKRNSRSLPKTKQNKKKQPSSF